MIFKNLYFFIRKFLNILKISVSFVCSFMQVLQLMEKMIILNMASMANMKVLLVVMIIRPSIAWLAGTPATCTAASVVFLGVIGPIAACIATSDVS